MTAPVLTLASVNLPDLNMAMDAIQNTKLSDWPGTLPDSSLAYAKETANTVLAGPASGNDAIPTWRQLSAADLSNGTTGSGAVVLATSPTMVTPTIGVATATSINKVAITAPATSATLTIADGKTLTASKSLTLTGTDSTAMTFPSTSATIARTDAAQTFTGDQTFSNNLVITGIASKYDNLTTAGLGLPVIVAKSELTGQTAATGAVTLIAANAPAAQYRVSAYLYTTTVGNAVTATFEYNFQDTVTSRGVSTSTSSIDISTSASGFCLGYFYASTGAITYDVSVSGALGTGVYAVYVTLERLT